MLVIGWASFLCSYLVNFAYCVVHPSGLDFNKSRFNNRLFIYVLGKKRYLPGWKQESAFDYYHEGKDDEDEDHKEQLHERSRINYEEKENEVKENKTNLENHNHEGKETSCIIVLQNTHKHLS